jgi:hypothetical protein
MWDEGEWVGGSPPHMLLLLNPANIALAIGARPAMPAAAALLQSESAPRIVVAISPGLLDSLSGLLGVGFDQVWGLTSQNQNHGQIQVKTYSYDLF